LSCVGAELCSERGDARGALARFVLEAQPQYRVHLRPRLPVRVRQLPPRLGQLRLFGGAFGVLKVALMMIIVVLKKYKNI
jgi:hypothetical protein